MHLHDDSTTIHINQNKSTGYILSWSNINVYGQKTPKFHFRFTKSQKSYQLKENDDSSETTLCSSQTKFKSVLNFFKGPSKMTQILSNVNGIVYPGESLAIMGSSGSGKSTLLNALNDRLSDKFIMSGNVQINGQKYYSNEFCNRIGYIFQDDVFIGTLTVKEHLTFQVWLNIDLKLLN
jgi:ABC-type multidrug transport system ATPase subunit